MNASNRRKDPKTLIRFRTVNSFTIDALEKLEIWGTKPYAFNDPYDCMSYVDISKVIEVCKQFIHEEHFDFETNLIPYIEGYSLGMIEIPTSLYYIVSFCSKKNIKNEMIWSYYADSAKGFALEYDFEELNNMLLDYNKQKNDIMVRISKVIYTKYKNDVTDVTIDSMHSIMKKLKESGTNCTVPERKQNFLLKRYAMQLKSAFTKSQKWKHEMEWRMLVSTKEDSDYACIGKLKPTKIYIGEKILKEHENKIIKIAKENSIPVFKMISDLYKPINSLKYECIFYPSKVKVKNL